MTTITAKTAAGENGADVELPEAIFGIEPNVAVMHQVVTAQLAAKRAGTHSTKTRAEVSGGGSKPWRQKGTGRARQGSIRAPHWRGGGVAHGPKPRDYSQRTPKKMVKLALRSALSDRAAEEKVLVVDDWGITEPKTKTGIQLLEALGLRTKGERKKASAKPTAGEAERTPDEAERKPTRKDPRVLLVLFRGEEDVWKSFRNLGERVQIILPEELNAYDILVNDWLVFSQATLEATVARLTDGAEIEVEVEVIVEVIDDEDTSDDADDDADDAEDGDDA
jgi:large subunit ribosomal protein L4